MNLSAILKLSSVLWAIWGLFHLTLGIAMVVLFAQGHPNGDFRGIPAVVDFTMFQMESPFPVMASLKQHGYNLAWIGLVVSIGSVYVWRKNVLAIFFCALVGGFSDLGYFVFVDLAGLAVTPGPEMTYICAAAIVTSFFVYFKSDKLKALS